MSAILRDDGSGLQITGEVPEPVVAATSSLLAILRCLSRALHNFTWTMELGNIDARRPGRYQLNVTANYRWAEGGSSVTTVIPAITAGHSISGSRLAQIVNEEFKESFALYVVGPTAAPDCGRTLNEIIDIVHYLDLARVFSCNFGPVLNFRPYLYCVDEEDYFNSNGVGEEDLDETEWTQMEARQAFLTTARMELNLHGAIGELILNDGDGFPGCGEGAARCFSDEVVASALVNAAETARREE